MSALPETLLVEDDEGVIEEYAAAFAEEGIALDVAETWDEALALFRVTGHRLVIADYNLPGDEHGLRLLIEMKLLVPSTMLVLISGALSKPAEELARRIEQIDAFHAKSSDLIEQLIVYAKDAEERAQVDTDWQRVGHNYLTPAEALDAQLAEIDDALRADISKKRGRG